MSHLCQRILRVTLGTFVFLTVGLISPLMSPSKFILASWLEPICQPAVYFAASAAAMAAMLLIFLREARLPFPPILAMSGLALLFGLIARSAGIALPSFFYFLTFLAIAPYIARNIHFFLKCAGWATTLNAVYSFVMLLVTSEVLSADILPVIPLAFSNGSHAAYDFRRASGFWYEPLAAGAIFGFSALMFRAMNRLEPSKLYRWFQVASFAGLLMTKSVAAECIFFLFIFITAGARMRVALLTATTVAIPLVAASFAMPAMRAYYEAKFHSFEIKTRLIAEISGKLTEQPLAMLFGGSFLDKKITYLESTAVKFILDFGLPFFGVAVAVILGTLVNNLRHVYSDPNLTPRRRDFLWHAHLCMVFPFALMFAQTSSLMPPVAIIFVLVLVYLRKASRVPLAKLSDNEDSRNRERAGSSVMMTKEARA